MKLIQGTGLQIGALLVLMTPGMMPLADETGPDLLDLDLATLLTIEISPSADASAAGLSPALPGGQIASGARLGILGGKPSFDTPYSITSYTSAFIADQQAASVGDVLQYDASVRVARGFGNYQQLYKVRGLPVYSDDMSYNGLHGILPRQYLAAELIERVEILRGANAFLNGAAPSASGLGGSVNVMPKRATNTDINRVGFGVQSNNQRYVATDIGRRSTDKRYGIRVNAVARDGDSAVEDEQRKLGMATLGLDFLGQQLRLSADMGYQDHQLDETQPSITIATGLNIPKAPDSSTSIAPDWTYSTEQDYFATLRAELDFSAQLTGWLAYGIRRGEEDSVFASSLTVLDQAGNFSANRFDVTREDHVNTGELGLHYSFDTAELQHRITLSANRFRNASRNAFAIYSGYNDNLYAPQYSPLPTTPAFIGGRLQQPRTTQQMYTSSIALADEIMVFDHLMLTLGVRRQTIENHTYDYNSGAELSAYDEHQYTPIAGFSVPVSAYWVAYGNYSEGLSQGDIAPDSNDGNPVTNAGASLQPYQTQQFELGMKYLGPELAGIFSLYEIRKPTAGFDRNNTLRELDKQIHHGLEVSLYGNLTPELKLLTGISFLKTDMSGKDAIGAPQVQYNLNLDWNSPVSGLSLTSHVMFTGKQYADADNLQPLPSWWRLDAGVRYTTFLWPDTLTTLRLNLENITDNDSWTSAGGFPGFGYLVLSEPRTLRAAVSFDF